MEGGIVARYRVLGISFDHIHMGDLLRQVADHPNAEIAGIFDPDRASMEAATGDRLKPTTRLPSPSLPKNCRRVMRVVIVMITSPARLVGSPGRCACAINCMV